MEGSSLMNQKFIDGYKKLGEVLRSHSSGKLPKVFHIIPHMANWEDVLFITKPD